MATDELPIRSPEWIGGAPVRTEAVRTIAAPPAVVWMLIADHAGWPSWFRELRAVEPGPTADAVGGTRRVTLPGVVVDEVFTEWIPERRFAFSVVSTSRRMVASMAEAVWLEPAGGGNRTVLTYRQGLEPAGVVGWLMTHPRSRMQRAIERAVDRLAASAEGG